MVALKRISLGILLVIAAACGGEKPAVSSRLTKVTMNLNPNIQYGPVVIAKEEGYFAEEGIDAELVQIDANSALMAVSTGKLDVLSSPVRSGLFNMIARGVPLQVVADRGHSEPGRCISEAFAAPTAMADEIAKNGGNLKGLKFAIIRGGNTEYLVDRVLASRHLTRDDVQFAQLPQGDYATSTSRRIDAIRYTQEPTLSNALSKGLMKVVVPMEEIAPGHQFGLLAYGKRLLIDDPDLGVRYMRAYLKGVKRYNEGKTDRNVQIVSGYTKFPLDVVKRACWQPVAPDGRIDTDRMQPFFEWARQHGYLEADIPTEKWWNPKFIEAATKP
jgi:ABC-type nitrate/sulfonate/bicarbonate transport system substrate-binding protein